MKLLKKIKLLYICLLCMIISLNNITPIIVQAKALSNNSFAAYSWILLSAKYDGEKINVNKIYLGTSNDDDEKNIIIDYTYNKRKKYAVVNIKDGEAEPQEYVPIFQLECDDLVDKYMILYTYSSKGDLEYNNTIGKSLKTKDVKKIYTKYKKADNYNIIS